MIAAIMWMLFIIHMALIGMKAKDMRFEMFLDYPSPYAYLASTQLAKFGVEVDFRPIHVLEVMKRVNNQPSPLCPPKARYSGIDARRWANLYGVPFEPHGQLLNAIKTGQFDRTLLTRAGIAAQELGVSAQVNTQLFSALWATAPDLMTEDGRAAFLIANSLPSDLWRLAADQRIIHRLAASIEEAAERGVFGVPTFFVDDEMFFGNDRLNFVEARLKGTDVSGVAA
jgi:2-hydroxychromene-2-carboxylate isomerase